MIQFGWFPSIYPMCSDKCNTTWLVLGCPIRRFPDQSLLSAPRDLSQSSTSFFGIDCQGIHYQCPYVPFYALTYSAIEVRLLKRCKSIYFFSSLSKLLNETLRTRRFYVFLQRERLKDYLSSQYFSSSQWLTRSTCLTCSHCSTIFLLLQHFFVIFLKNLSIGLVRRPYRRESSAIEPRYQCVRPLLNGANSDHLSLNQRS